MEQDRQAEVILLSLATDNKYTSDIVSKIVAEDFTTIPHKELFNLINDMFNHNEDISLLSIDSKNHEVLKNFMVYNSFAKMAEISMVAVKSDIGVMIDRIKKATESRNLMHISRSIQDMVNNNMDTSEIVEEIQNGIINIEKHDKEENIITPENMAMICADSAANRMDEEKRNKDVIYSPFKKLNQITGGFEKGDLIILSGSTGGGKSAFALNLAYPIGVIQKRPTLFINTEMSANQMALRYDSYISGISHTDLRNGNITVEQFGMLAEKLSPMQKGKLFTLTMTDLKIQSAIAEIIKFKRQQEVEVVIVDYIGRTDSLEMKKDDWQVLKSAAQKLKTMAQDLNLVVIMLAQLSESGKLAQASYMAHEADLWINIKRIKDEDELNHYYPWNSLIQFKKARNSDIANDATMYFDGDKMRFYDDVRIAEHSNQEKIK